MQNTYLAKKYILLIIIFLLAANLNSFDKKELIDPVWFAEINCFIYDEYTKTLQPNKLELRLVQERIGLGNISEIIEIYYNESSNKADAFSLLKTNKDEETKKRDKNFEWNKTAVKKEAVEKKEFRRILESIKSVLSESSYRRNCIRISEDKKIKLLEAINKYGEWNKIAINEKVEIEKDIENLRIDVWWKTGEEWFNSKKNMIFIGFLSQDKNRHQLVLRFSMASSIDNNYITHRPKTLFFDQKDVEVLKNILDEDYIQKRIEEIKIEKEAEDALFKN